MRGARGCRYAVHARCLLCPCASRACSQDRQTGWPLCLDGRRCAVSHVERSSKQLEQLAGGVAASLPRHCAVACEYGAGTGRLVLGVGDSARWQVEASYGRAMFGDADPQGNPKPCGGVLSAQLEPDEFLVTGYHVRVRFEPTPQIRKAFMLVRVEEGHYERGKWIFGRLPEWRPNRLGFEFYRPAPCVAGPPG